MLWERQESVHDHPPAGVPGEGGPQMQGGTWREVQYGAKGKVHSCWRRENTRTMQNEHQAGVWGQTKTEMWKNSEYHDAC